MFGAIEAGGTKFVCSIGNTSLEIVDQVTIPTETPETTMRTVISFFEKYQVELQAIGIGSFGPIDIREESSTYGYITQTPKLAWRNYDFVGAMKKAFPMVNIAWTTDVNAAAYGEYSARRNVKNLVYYTVGTGIGGGAIQNGEFIQGYSHPEMGHTLVRRHKSDFFVGICPSHGDCLEGLASGPAIEKRLGISAEKTLAADSYWDIQAYYLAQSAYNATLYVAPEVIIYGGGVMKVEGLVDKVRAQFKRLSNEYVTVPPLDEYIVLPKLGDNAATVGCLALAKNLVAQC